MDLEWNSRTRNALNQMKLVESHEVMPSPWRSPAFCQPWAVFQARLSTLSERSERSRDFCVRALLSKTPVSSCVCKPKRWRLSLLLCVILLRLPQTSSLKASCFLRRTDKADLVLTLPGAKTCNCWFCGKHLKKWGLRERWKLTGVSS